MNSYDSARRWLNARENPPTRVSEMEIQARLFAGEYGTRWTTTAGSEVEILHFGRWNHEAGPDFIGVRFRFEGEPECEGDLEVDMDVRDWERHGHATNPDYAGVCLQLFVDSPGARAFARTSDFREIPQAHLSVGDTAALPLRHMPGAVDREAALAMIEEAAEFRLRQKHAAHVRAVSLHGPETAMFHAIAAGLGYKNNSIPFLLSAQRTGLRAAGGSDGEARLFGMAGFLQPRTFDMGDEATQNYLKPLWDKWWALRDSFSRLALLPDMWKFSGIRPSNHPHRRMGALAAISSQFSGFRAAIKSGGAKGFSDFFGSLTHPYWSRHWNLSAGLLATDLSLVGPDRIRDLLVNAYLPSLPLDKAREVIRSLRGNTPGGRIRLASEWLIGSVDRELMRSASQQQGLLQLYADFGSLTALEAWAKIRAR